MWLAALLGLWAGFAVYRYWPNGLLWLLVIAAAMMGLSLYFSSHDPLFDPVRTYNPVALSVNFTLQFVSANFGYLVAFVIKRKRGGGDVG